VHALGGQLRVLVSGYDTGLREVAAYQQRPDAGAPDRRRVRPAWPQGQPVGRFRSRCREQRTPSGRLVFLGLTEGGAMAVALLDGTLVRLEQIDMLPERDVLAYFDALQPVAVQELEF
jgi:hypothetical protein